jgi:NAD(P)-dependent dehydrogenase (short-subunit alcohol dehydrogenase family)
MVPRWNVSGRTVLITGAARGIGAESARRLSAQGARLALVGLEPERLAEVAEACGPDSAWFEADVTEPDAIQAAVDGAVEQFGGLDAVIANAGIARAGPVRHATAEAFERVIEVNLLGAYRTVRACLPHIVARRGYVLVIASMAAVVHTPGLSAYSASKAGVEAFSDSLRAEVRHLGVDVGVGYLSFIDTEMVRGTDRHPAFAGLRAQVRGPAAKTYPVSAVGDAIVEGFARRRRTVVVPPYMRGTIALRGMIGRLVERVGAQSAAELDERFARDVAERGAEEASSAIGAGGAADAAH